MDLDEIRSTVREIRERNIDGGPGSGPPLGNQNAYKGGSIKDRFESMKEKAFDPGKDLVVASDNGRTWDERVKDGKERYEARREYDLMYRDQTKKALSPIKSIRSKELSAALRYTGDGYKEMNTALRNDDTSDKDVVRANETLSSVIDRSKLKSDTMLYRSTSANSIARMVGIKKEDITPENIKNLVGMSGTEKGFSSTTSVKPTDYYHDDEKYKGKNVDIEILAPKGTKALWAEPISRYGYNYSNTNDCLEYKYDGGAKDHYGYDHFNECETIVQSGTTYTIADASYDERENRYKIKMMITGQGRKKFK